MKLIVSDVLKNVPIADGIFSMAVSFAEGTLASPGQFAMLYLPNGELLLPRPISISDANEGSLTFVYAVVGAGTAVLSRLQPGDSLKLLAPLGKGFFISPIAKTPQKKPAIIGGGIGVAPLLYLAKTLASRGKQPDIYLGFRTAPYLVEEFEKYGHVHIATEDGSVGHHGRVLDIFPQNKHDEIMACGPTPLLNAIAELSDTQKIPAQLSYEERMACGIGTCVGCVLEVEGTYFRICTEGPVFYT